MLRLRNEGPLKPAPALKGIAQDVSLTIQSWPGVLAATHWRRGDPTAVDGAEFHIEEGELGHIHLNGEIHLALTEPLRNLLVKLKLAEPFVYHKAWVQASISSPHEAEQAAWLFRLAYDRLRSTEDGELRNRIQSRFDQPISLT